LMSGVVRWDVWDLEHWHNQRGLEDGTTWVVLVDVIM